MSCIPARVLPVLAEGPEDSMTGTAADVEKGMSIGPACSSSHSSVAEHGHATTSGVRGNPGPFGLLGFGMTTCMLMFITTTWTGPGFSATVMAYALFYGGLGQFIAGILELIRGSTFAGTAFASYGCFWMGWCFWKFIEADKIVSSVATTALTGDTLWCILWGTLTLGFFVVTLRKNGCLQFIFGTLFITFYLLAGANYNHNCKLAAGYIGFFCGASAIYAALAMLYQDELGYTLPGLKPTHYI